MNKLILLLILSILITPIAISDNTITSSFTITNNEHYTEWSPYWRIGYFPPTTQTNWISQHFGAILTINESNPWIPLYFGPNTFIAQHTQNINTVLIKHLNNEYTLKQSIRYHITSTITQNSRPVKKIISGEQYEIFSFTTCYINA